MKRFYKNSLIIALTCIFLGIIVTLAGVAGGGISLFEEMVNNNEFSFGSDNKIGIHLEDEDYSSSTDTEVIYEYPVSEYDIKDLDLDIGASELKIEYEDTDTYRVYVKVGDGSEHGCKVKDGALKIESSTDIKLFSGQYQPQEITLTIPESVSLREIDITIGAGALTAEKLEGKEIELEVGAGNIEVETLSSEKEMNLSVGAGNMEIDAVWAEKLEAACEAGRMYVDNVKVSSNVDVNCDVGYFYMNLAEEESSFNYDLECSLGDLSVGGESHSGFDFEDKIDNGANRNLKAECNVGSLEIEFMN